MSIDTTHARVITPTTEEVASGVLDRLAAAWNAGDGTAFGAVYDEEAMFVTIRGELIRGRAAIAAGHGEIFATIYRGSTNEMVLLSAERIADDVVIATSRNTLTAPTGPLQGVHSAMSTSVIVRGGRGRARAWRAVATHNTLVVTR